jgi:uncharacterized membrane protein
MCMQNRYDIEANYTTNNSHQASEIIERVHKVINDLLRFLIGNNNENPEDLYDLEDDLLKYFLR